MYFSRPEQLLVAFRELFEVQKGLLGLRYIAIQGEDLIPEYPCLEISTGTVNREDHGTQRFLLTFEMSFWIYHANYETGWAGRTIEDLQLTTEVVRFLHTRKNRALNDDTEDKLINGSGRVMQEQPGVTNLRGTGARVATTRLVWVGQSQVNYEDS